MSTRTLGFRGLVVQNSHITLKKNASKTVGVISLYLNFSKFSDTYFQVWVMMLGNVEGEIIKDVSIGFMFHLFLFLMIYIINNLIIAVTVSKTDFIGLQNSTRLMRAESDISVIDWSMDIINWLNPILKFMNLSACKRNILQRCKEAKSYKV